MTDDLRTRIARAAWVSHRDRQLAQLGMNPSEYAADIPIPDWAYAIADAVIRELGVQPPGLQPDGTYIDPTGIVWRHTGSEWTDDPNYRP